MFPVSPKIALLLLLLLAASPSRGEDGLPRIFDGIGRNTADAFLGWDALLHAGGVGATWGMVETGADYRIHDFFRGKQTLQYAFLPVGLTGSLGPLILGGVLHYRGRNDADLRGAGCAVLQSTLVSFTYITLLKAVTGRPNPDPEEYGDMEEASRTFRWGFGKGGIFWGWPSGHTGVTVAAVSSLMAYYPEKTWLKAAGYPFIAYTMAGVCAIGDGSMHWASDAVAGALMGWAIGTSVGKGFRQRRRDVHSGLVPRVVPAPEYGGVALVWTL